MIEWNKMNKFCKWSYEDYMGTQRCEKRSSNPCNYTHCPIRTTPEPKAIEKIFKIKYILPKFASDKKNELNCMALKKILDNAVADECNFLVTEFDPRVWEITKIPEKIKEIDLKHVSIDGGCGFTYKTEKSEEPEIWKACHNCGWNKDHVCGLATDRCDSKYSAWKPIEKTENKEIPVILKECGKCGWWDNDVYRCNSENVLDCGSNKSEWKPIKPEIVKNCENCGFSYDDTLCNNEKSCISISEWKPIEKKEKKVKWIFDTKYCSNCAKKIGTGKYDCKCKED